jgi:DNA-binding PadR family transcriptional regulator
MQVDHLSPGAWAVLGAVAEGPTHGFAVVQLMAPHGPIGRIWTIPHPVVYQVLKRLQQLRLITERATERGGRGPQRTILAVTPAGRRALRRWLLAPVDHVRDVRSLFLLKMVLLDRAAIDPSPLLEAQREQVETLVAALTCQHDAAEGFDQVLVTWRLESSRAVLRFLESVSSSSSSSAPL